MIYTHTTKRRAALMARDNGAEIEAENAIIQQAKDILMLRMTREKYNALNSTQSVRDYLRIVLANNEREEFWCIWLDAQHRVLSADMCFVGTLTQTSVYPREIVRDAVTKNAASVIFAHNHPSGITEPSHADELLTRTLKSALALVDVQVLDHFIVAGGKTLSFAERGLL